MEEKLLKIFKLADALNEKQDKVYAEIKYCANNSETLEIAFRSKTDFTYKGKCEISLADNPLLKWDNVIELLEKHIENLKDTV